MRETITKDKFSRLDMVQQGNEITLHQMTDVEPALRKAEMLRQAGATKTHDGDHLAAVIPIALLQEWANKRGVDWQVVAQDDRLLDKFLRDPDYKKCRVYEGNV